MKQVRAGCFALAKQLVLPWQNNRHQLLLSGLLALCGSQALAQDSAWMPYWDAKWRYESTDLPGLRNDIRRNRFYANLGTVLSDESEGSGFEFGAGLSLNAGTDNPARNRANKDNQRSNQVGIDRLYARIATGAITWQFGKAPLGMGLSPLVWDQDLRPIGLSAEHSGVNEQGDGLRANLGYYAPDFAFDNEKPRLAAAQLGWHWHEGQMNSASMILSYLRFSRLTGLPGNGIARTNRRVGLNYLSDYELLDLQLIGRTHLFAHPLTVALDGVNNLGADDADQAARISITAGDSKAGGWEAGFAYQRNQRDAVLAIAADDEWWFQSFSRGGMPWLAYGFAGGGTVLRLASFDERRDGSPSSAHRVLLDLSLRW
jgi:hypothetical protein